MRKMVLGALALACLAMPAGAQSLDERRCQALERLGQPCTPAAPLPVGPSQWTHSVTRDPMTDFQNSVWSLEAVRDIANGFIGYSRPVLEVGCVNNTTRVVVDWNRYVSIDTTSVSHRVDDAAAVRATWRLSTDFEATFSPAAIAALRSMVGGRAFVVTTVPYGSPTVLAEFHIAGFEDVIAEVSSRCGWTP